MWTKDQLIGLMPVEVLQSDAFAAEIYKGTGPKPYTVYVHYRRLKKRESEDPPTEHFDTFGDAKSFAGRAIYGKWDREPSVR